MIRDNDLAASFQTKSYFKILDFTQFAIAIAESLPGYRGGVEGACLYQTNAVIRRDIGTFSPDEFKDEKGNIVLDRIFKRVNESMDVYPYFLKRDQFRHQAEYRFVWNYVGDGADYMDIVAPKAVQFCERADPFEE